MRAGRIALLFASGALILGCDVGDGTATATSSTPTAPLVTPGPVAATELTPGDCITGLAIGAAERARIDSASVVSCTQPHELEVFATFDLDLVALELEDEAYPGQQRVVDAADEGCEIRLGDLGAAAAEAVGVITIWPTAQSWGAGDRTVACVAFRADGSPFDRPGILADG